MQDLPRIALFVEVARQSSFIGAARQLGLTGSAVSKQIRILEEALGVRLLQRTTRQVSLTGEGQAFFEQCELLITQLESAKESVRQQQSTPRGKLRINVPVSFGIRELTEPLARFAATYPEVQLEVDMHDRYVDVVQEGYDLVIRVGQLEDSSLIARKLAPCPIYLVASPEYQQAVGLLHSPKDLLNCRWVEYHQHGRPFVWHYRDAEGHSGSLNISSHFKANNAEMMAAAIATGVGIGLVPYFTADDYLAEGKLVRLLPDFTTQPDRHVYALYPNRSFLPQRTRVLLDFLSDHFAGKVRKIR